MSNIEEDIDILEKFNPGDEYTEKIKRAIENILVEREVDKKRIKELEEENRIQRRQLNSAFDRGWIPKQKVKDKIEELKKEYEDSKDENGESEYYYPDYAIRKLEELLNDK